MKKISISFDKLVSFLLYWLPLQDIVMGIAYRFTHSAGLAYVLLFSKDVMLFILILMCLQKKPQLTRLNKLIFVYLGWIVIYIPLSFAISDARIGQIASSLRGLLLCPLGIYLGYSVENCDKLLDFYKNKYFKYLFVLAIIGIIEWLIDYFVGTIPFWTDFVGIGNLYSEIKGIMNYKGLPGNFYGYSAAGEFTRKRLVSVWGNPLTSGYNLLVPMVYYIVMLVNRKHTRDYCKNTVYGLVFACAIILSYTRAIILGTLIAIACLFIYKNSHKVKNIIVAFLMTVCVAIIYLIVGDKKALFQFLYDGSTIAHIDHLVANIVRVGFTGSGIGGFGSTESVYLSIWGQIGFVGLVLFCLVSLQAIMNAFKNVEKFHDIALATAISWITFMITGVISEQLTAFTTIVPWYILLGIVQANRSPETETE